MTLPAEETPLLFQLQTPSRKKVLPGDIFSMKLPEGYLFGRVIATNAKSSRWDEPHLHLLYIYKGIRKTVADFQIDDFRPPQLLIPPVITNRLGWSRGVYETVGHAPLETADRLEQDVFLRPGSQDYWDENANPIKESAVKDKSMAGVHGLHSYMTIENEVSVALGLGPTY